MRMVPAYIHIYGILAKPLVGISSSLKKVPVSSYYKNKLTSSLTMEVFDTFFFGKNAT